MNDKQKKLFAIIIYAINGTAAFLAFVFGLCYAIKISAIYGCMIMFFGILASLSFCMIMRLLLAMVCELRAKNSCEADNAQEDKKE